MSAAESLARPFKLPEVERIAQNLMYLALADSVLASRLEKSFLVSPAFELEGNETKVIEGSFQLPGDAKPTYNGAVSHDWSIRGRLEAFGNDPDSGFQSMRVGVR